MSFLQFRTYTIKAGKGGGVVPLILCDTMGLEENADAGLDIEDLVSIYKGHIKDRYQVSYLHLHITDLVVRMLGICACFIIRLMTNE